MHWTEKEFAFYRGEENICDGTIAEIAAVTGNKVEYVKWMTTPTAEKRRSPHDFKFTTRLVPIIDETRSLMTYKLKDEALDALFDHEIFTVGDLMKVSDEQLSRLHPRYRIREHIARYRNSFLEVEKEWSDDCDEAM